MYRWNGGARRVAKLDRKSHSNFFQQQQPGSAPIDGGHRMHRVRAPPQQQHGEHERRDEGGLDRVRRRAGGAGAMSFPLSRKAEEGSGSDFSDEDGYEQEEEEGHGDDAMWEGQRPHDADDARPAKQQRQHEPEEREERAAPQAAHHEMAEDQHSAEPPPPRAQPRPESAPEERRDSRRPPSPSAKDKDEMVSMSIDKEPSTGLSALSRGLGSSTHAKAKEPAPAEPQASEPAASRGDHRNRTVSSRLQEDAGSGKSNKDSAHNVDSNMLLSEIMNGVGNGSFRSRSTGRRRAVHRETHASGAPRSKKHLLRSAKEAGGARGDHYVGKRAMKGSKAAESHAAAMPTAPKAEREPDSKKLKATADASTNTLTDSGLAGRVSTLEAQVKALTSALDQQKAQHQTGRGTGQHTEASAAGGIAEEAADSTKPTKAEPAAGASVADEAGESAAPLPDDSAAKAAGESSAEKTDAVEAVTIAPEKPVGADDEGAAEAQQAKSPRVDDEPKDTARDSAETTPGNRAPASSGEAQPARVDAEAAQVTAEPEAPPASEPTITDDAAATLTSVSLLSVFKVLPLTSMHDLHAQMKSSPQPNAPSTTDGAATKAEAHGDEQDDQATEQQAPTTEQPGSVIAARVQTEPYGPAYGEAADANHDGNVTRSETAAYQDDHASSTESSGEQKGQPEQAEPAGTPGSSADRQSESTTQQTAGTDEPAQAEAASAAPKPPSDSGEGQPAQALTSSTPPRAEPSSGQDSNSLRPILPQTRIEVYWDGDDAWYSGLVLDVRDRSPRYLVRYDDDEVSWESDIRQPAAT